MKKEPKIVPRGKQVLVRPDEAPASVSAHGIATPTNIEQEQKAIGTVVATGKDIKDIKKGQRVIYGAYAGEKLSLTQSNKEVDYVLLFDEDVLAFLED